MERIKTYTEHYTLLFHKYIDTFGAKHYMITTHKNYKDNGISIVYSIKDFLTGKNYSLSNRIFPHIKGKYEYCAQNFLYAWRKDNYNLINYSLASHDFTYSWNTVTQEYAPERLNSATDWYYDIIQNQNYKLIKTIEEEYKNNSKYRWKTERLVFAYTKELYPDTIFQYHPDFLKSKIGGSMSYDVFIPSLQTAIEYQGEQHFEYNSFFHKNNIENFYYQQERDKLKLTLSTQNNINLIYINYDENITKELIKLKINQKLKGKEMYGISRNR